MPKSKEQKRSEVKDRETRRLADELPQRKRILLDATEYAAKNLGSVYAVRAMKEAQIKVEASEQAANLLAR